VAPPNRGGAFLTQFFVVKDSYVVLVLICDATFVIFFCVVTMYEYTCAYFLRPCDVKVGAP